MNDVPLRERPTVFTLVTDGNVPVLQMVRLAARRAGLAIEEGGLWGGPDAWVQDPARARYELNTPSIEKIGIAALDEGALAEVQAALDTLHAYSERLDPA
jgi:hypothetical protein